MFLFFLSDQLSLLNPSRKNIIMGNVLSQIVDESVVKKLPSRRLEAFAGNFSSYARVANSQQLLAAAMEMNEVIATIGEIRAENENEKISKAAIL